MDERICVWAGGRMGGWEGRRKEERKKRYKFLDNLNKSLSQRRLSLGILIRTGYWLLFPFNSYWRNLGLYKKKPLFFHRWPQDSALRLMLEHEV